MRKRLGLSTEPQPVFVGACFALIMLLMQFYILQIAKNGNLVSVLNSPLALIGLMLNNAEGSIINSVIWLGKTVLPVAVLLFAVVFGKKHAGLLCIPCAVPGLFTIGSLLLADFNAYHISYVIYSVSAVLFVLTVFLSKNAVKPFIAYCTGVCLVVIILTVLKQPPFTLFDGSVYLSDMIYFICYHIAIANFGRAVAIQKR